MKLISTSLARIIVAIAVVLIVLSAIGTIFIPALKEFATITVPSEKNYVINDEESELLTLSSTVSVHELLVTDEAEDIDIFANLTASSSTGANLLSQLKEDYAKPVLERESVFIYKINKDGSAKLSSEIDSSVVSEWAVVFVLKDGTERETLKVNYVFLN